MSDEKRVGSLVHEGGESHTDLPASAGVKDLNFQPDCASSRLHVSQRGVGNWGRLD